MRTLGFAAFLSCAIALAATACSPFDPELGDAPFRQCACLGDGAGRAIRLNGGTLRHAGLVAAGRKPLYSALVRRLGRVEAGAALGVVYTTLFALGLFVATNILVLKGGDDVGQHLGLLANYFPGYDVTFAGSLLGAVYAFVVGYVVGRVLCAVYNVVARP